MKNSEASAVSFLFEMGTLRKIARSHRQTLLTDDLSDNIASHSFRVTIIGWMLAKAEGANIEKTVSMCLFHDMEEARTGDQNWVHKPYVSVDERKILSDQTSAFPQGGDILHIKEEYLARESREARIAKDADLLDQLLLLKEYQMCGNQEAGRWLAGKEKHERGEDKDIKNIHGAFSEKLFCDTAKRYAEEIFTQKPSDWWENPTS